MAAIPQLPKFFSTTWYRDPSDHRCPHDAWLEAVELSESSEGERGEIRKTAISIRLLGAYHDGYITLRYRGVRRHSLVSNTCSRGLGDWLEDMFSLSDEGLIVHRITWAGFGAGGESRWSIEAEDVAYEWMPKEANQQATDNAGNWRG